MKNYTKISDTEAEITKTEVVRISADELKAQIESLQGQIDAATERAGIETRNRDEYVAGILAPIDGWQAEIATLTQDLKDLKKAGVEPTPDPEI